MRYGVLVCALLLSIFGFGQEHQAASNTPTQFEVARHTFFDFGPPFDFYEVYLVRASGSGAAIKRITVTPAGQKCLVPPTVEIKSASTSGSVAALLGGKDPCSIPESSLRRERKRRKDFAFSGAMAGLRVACGTETRMIRSDILDKDLFDPKPNTPEQTSWTMSLLVRMDALVGPGVMHKPMTSLLAGQRLETREVDSVEIQDLAAGKYDGLFQEAEHKLSDLYRESQKPLPQPSVELVSSVPVLPETFVLPDYPSIARVTRTEGTVIFTVEVDANGAAREPTFESGHPFLRQAVINVVPRWKFPRDVANRRIRATIQFSANCPKD